MNTAFEFHDSVLSTLYNDKDIAILAFAPAYIHRSEGVPGVDTGTGWNQTVLLVLKEVELLGIPPQLPCRILGGSVSINASEYREVVPIISGNGSVRVRLDVDNGTRLIITSKHLHILLVGDAVYIEDFP